MFLLGTRTTHRINPAMSCCLAVWLVMVGTTQLPLFSNAAAQQESSTQKAHPASALIERARKLIQSGDPRGALSLLEQGESSGTGASDLHALRGICFAMTAKPIESMGEFDQAIALRPKYAPYYLSAGLAAASFNNLDRAAEMLATAQRLDPELPGVRYNYALVLARETKYADSENQVDIELKNKGPRAEAPVELWKLKARDAHYQKKWQDTVDSYGKVLEFQPDSAEGYAAIGEALYSLNRSQESETALRKAVSLDPQQGTAHEILGKLYQDDGKPDKAIPEFEAAIRLMPNNREPIYRLFRIYTAQGDKANAARIQKQLQDVIASNFAESNNEAKATVLNNTAIELEQKGDLASALEDYDQAAKTDMTNIVFQRNAALLLCKMGRTQEAIRRLKDILSLDSNDAETLQILAVANELADGQRGGKKTLPTPESSH